MSSAAVCVAPLLVIAGFRWPGSAEIATTSVPPRTGVSCACAVAHATTATRTATARRRIISGLQYVFDPPNQLRKTEVSRHGPGVQRWRGHGRGWLRFRRNATELSAAAGEHLAAPDAGSRSGCYRTRGLAGSASTQRAAAFRDRPSARSSALVPDR